MIIIYPPLTKPCEPPAALGILGAVLKFHNIECSLIDMNYEGIIYLLEHYFERYPKKRHYLNLLTTKEGYSNFDRYTRALDEINRGLNYLSDKNHTLSLSNYQSEVYNPLRSSDLLKVAEEYKTNIFYTFYKHRLDELLSERHIKSIGISLQFINQAIPTFALIGLIKCEYPWIKVVLGGGLITSWVKSKNWINPFSELGCKIISGPGEYRILEFLDVSPINGFEEEIIPDYTFAENYKYFSPGPIIPVNGSTGCGWKRCTFCPEKAEDNPYSSKCNTKFLHEIKILNDKYNPSLFHILDNEINPSLLSALIESENRTPWYGFTKFYKELKDIDFCKHLAESGCKMLKLGLESGDQDVLNAMKKGILLEDASIILENLYLSGIKTFVYILFGTPEEDRDAALRTRDYIIKHHKYITYLNLAIFNLPINSEISSRLELYNLSESDLGLYAGFKHPKGWNKPEIRKFISKEFESVQEIRNIIKRTPPNFNANHGTFFSF